MAEHIKIPHRQAFNLIKRWGLAKIQEQFPSVVFISLYLIIFQVFILGMPVSNALTLVAGIALVILGLAFFLEGLSLGLMPLGERLGQKMPAKAPLGVLLIFAAILGVGATLAEPAIASLKIAGSSVQWQNSPLLHMMLNQHTAYLIMAIGMGVGLAVLLGIVRFVHGWSLKPLLLILVPVAIGLSILLYTMPLYAPIVGLAWDCGGITTGPVTVPLVLAFGLGISQVTGKNDSPLAGFGIVTLASIIPVIAVMLLGLAIGPQAGTYDGTAFTVAPMSTPIDGIFTNIPQIVLQSAQAVLPLSLFMLLTILLFLREKLEYPDQVIFGIALSLVGMIFLNIGIEYGLSKLGKDLGVSLPAAVKAIEIPDAQQQIPHFASRMIQQVLGEDGTVREYLYIQKNNNIQLVPYIKENLNPETGTYHLVTVKGPIFGPNQGILGLMVLLVFGFFMGYGATMAEPALIALGKTVENITVGIFKSKSLMQAVAVGVGIGLSFGVLKLMFAIPLIWLLVPPYLLLLVLTLLSDESYVNIAWDSAGVTTGPVTVPLVIAMGLGLGSQLGTLEGFGVLALASVWPILTVLSAGFLAKRRDNANINAHREERR